MKKLTVGLWLVLFVVSVQAKVSLPAIFSDHAVLQKSAQTAIWGTAAPGEKVAVSLGADNAGTVVADDQGNWCVRLNLSNSPVSPMELVVQGGDNRITVSDVMVGDVWLCSGQSNMEFKLSQSMDGSAEIAVSGNRSLRCFIPQRKAVRTPARELGGKWVVAGPETSGAFSAVAYYFAKAVQASVPGPVGLIDTSWGGTPAEAWISAQGLDSQSGLKKRKDELLAARGAYDDQLEKFQAQFAQWTARYQRADRPAGDPSDFAGPEIVAADWTDVSLPGSLAAAKLPDSGVVWLRRTVEIPPSRAGAYLPLLLGSLRDFETVYWNGEQIGLTTAERSSSFNPDLVFTANRRYDVPGNRVKAGKNILAIRLFSPGGNAGLDAGRFSAGWDIPLNGTWQAKPEYALPPLGDEAKAAYPRRPDWPPPLHYMATYLSNGMVAPLANLSLKGVIWYQGEANVGRAWQYRMTFPLLIQDWRRQLHDENLPFYFCQLANFSPKKTDPAESGWAELREAQAKALSLPNTGMAVLIDLGEEADIHPRNKRDAGLRLAALALAKTYGRGIAYSGPICQKAEVQGDSIRIYFSHADGGLVARQLPATYQPKSSYPATKPLTPNSPGSELQGFMVSGDDGVWKWANAKIEGETVVVRSPSVSVPKYVRYAWADNPTCNLYNQAGFPAEPFRTDDYPVSTLNSRF
ncbi:MAG: sialate O-acetylesterase [Verrucomicrobiales bacterium]|nr:sialate O-acetylesterase [Verrucomicrobiales bacterium]